MLSSHLQVFDVVETGELMELTVADKLQSELDSERVLIIVDDDDRKIWLWKGAEAGVRKKFIAARQGQAVRSQRGLVYKVMSIDGGDEPDDFLVLLGQKPKPPAPKPEVAVQVDLPDKTIEISADEPLPHPKPVPKVEAPAPKPIPKSMPVATNNLGTEYDGAEQQWPKRAVATTMTPSPAHDEIVGRVQNSTPPPGYSRELVVIGQEVFTSVDRTVSILGETRTNTFLERTRTLPDGPFFGGDYTPRILVEDGRVLATEFLKKIEDASHGLRDSTADADVSELIDIFRITTDANEVTESKKKSRKSKK
ncbi:MAG: hypothetical protein ACFE89_10220 [Candidatus Hodarchaeota archaeon]